MENANWNGKRISAHEIAKNYQTEKMVRRASSEGQLICTDPGCEHPILRYCHGPIKGPFFAHRINTNCDYEQWEKTNGNYDDFRVKLYEHFKSNGHSVQMEVKVLKHHYSHLLFEGEDGNRTALEIGDKSMNIKTIENLAGEYKDLGISVSWIEIGKARKYVEEDRTYFFERFCLNENNKCLLILDQETDEVAQYKADENPYIYRGQWIYSKNYPRVFSYISTLSDLCYENGSFTLQGFEAAYQEFIARKQNAFEKYVKEEDEKRRLKNEQSVKYIKYHEDVKMERSFCEQNITIDNVEKEKNEIRKDIEFRIKKFPTTGAKDYLGNRWFQCVKCSKLDHEGAFAVKGGLHGINYGICKECNKDGNKDTYTQLTMDDL